AARPRRSDRGAAPARQGRAGRAGISVDAGARPCRRLDPGAGRQRGLRARRARRGKAVAMSSEPKSSRAESELLAAVRAAARQEQFLEVVSAEEAKKRFEGHLDLTPLPGERVTLAAALGRVLADDLAAPID